MRKPIPESWGLNESQVKEIFEVEKRQADILCKAPPNERKKLYGPVYEDYFKQLPFHPQFTIKADDKKKKERVDFQLAQLMPFINKETAFAEIGAGDCSLSLAVASKCKQVYALEVSEEIVSGINFPENVEPIIFDGFDIPIGENSVDLVYSNQLMEHLHPEDAKDQAKSILKMLKPGGRYICITPNKLLGPHDISRFFTEELLCFHLKEYSGTDLRNLFLEFGYKKVEFYSIIKGKKMNIPFFVIRLVEQFVSNFNQTTRAKFAKRHLFRIVLNATFSAVK